MVKVYHTEIMSERRKKRAMQLYSYLLSREYVSSHECNKSSVRCIAFASRRSAIRRKLVRRSLYD